MYSSAETTGSGNVGECWKSFTDDWVFEIVRFYFLCVNSDKAQTKMPSTREDFKIKISEFRVKTQALRSFVDMSITFLLSFTFDWYPSKAWLSLDEVSA